MNILLLSHAFYPHVGGLETVARVLAEEFHARGHAVRVVTQSLAGAGDGRAGRDATEFPFPVHRRPGRRELLGLTRWCDVFFQNNISLQTLWPLALVRRPWVVTHQTWLTRVDGSLGWQDRVKAALLRGGATSVAISRAVAARLPTPAAAIIGNPYAAGSFGPRSGVTRGGGVAFLGRLVSDKGVDLLLEALAVLKREDGLAPPLSVLGDGPERANLEALASRLGLDGQVAFLGQRTGETLVETLNVHRVLAVPSRWAEPFGVVALEGLACGCVVVGSDGGGLPDAIGPGGLTFPNGDVPALAAALRRALTDEPLRARCLADAPAHLAAHSPGSVADAYLGVFGNVVRGRGKKARNPKLEARNNRN